MLSRLVPMTDFVRMIRSHESLIINWFKAKNSFPPANWRNEPQSESGNEKKFRLS